MDIAKKIFLGVLSLRIFCFYAPALHADDPNVKKINDLVKIWETRSLIKSFESTSFRFTGTGGTGTARFNRRQVQELVAAVSKYCDGSDITLDGLTSLTSHLYHRNPNNPVEDNLPMGGWSVAQNSQDRDSFRYEFTTKDVISRGVRRPDGDEDYFSGMNQATIYNGQSSNAFESLNDLILYSPDGIENYRVDWQLRELNENRVLFTGIRRDGSAAAATELDVDSQTGFVHHLLYHGVNPYELWQFFPLQIANSSAMQPPKVFIKALYDDTEKDAVKILLMYVFTKLELNTQIPAERFQLSVDGPMTVVKSTPNQSGRPPTFASPTGVRNLATLRDSPLFERKGRSQPIQRQNEASKLADSGHGSFRPTLVLLNVFGLILATVWMIFRRRAK